MLRIFNNLDLFFEDNYAEINVRKYAKLKKISPPTASKLLKEYAKELLLIKKEDKGHHEYSANRKNELFKDMCLAYWKHKITQSGLVTNILDNNISPAIFIFGSITNAEITKNSDVDVAVFDADNLPEVSKYEKYFGRELQIFELGTAKQIKSKELLKNILKGVCIYGEPDKLERLQQKAFCKGEKTE